MPSNNPRGRAAVLRALAIFVAAPFVLLFSIPSSGQTAAHDRAFWQAIAKNKYNVPEHESADVLAREVSGLLASPDPELRDDLAYSIYVRWIYRNYISPPTLIALTDEWRANLKDGIGESGTNSVLKRSFSALCLSVMAEREAKTPFMGEARYHQLVGDAITYLQSERDLRGYDSKVGWIHANAHTADLLQGLAHSPLLTKEEQEKILTAIATRLSTAPDVYIQGEQDRMAAAIVAVIRLPSVDAAAFNASLTQIDEEDKQVWANPLTPQTLARYQNHTYFLQALAVRLSLEADSPRVTDFKGRVLGILKTR
ncbi:MAG TPA: DUF2785 domain-containing protein [Terriglobales bacterium]|jgi:hypothetical protein|nr:DUF2785 domain-containing protein [Terriglobales bacterium]